MSLDATAEFSASGMAGGDGIIADNNHKLLELMRYDDLLVSANRSDG